MTKKHATEPTSTFNDALIFGDLKTVESYLSEPITLAFGKNREAKKWRNTEMKIGEFIASLTEHKEARKKDGAAYLQGELVAPTRSANNVRQLDLLILDMDTGQPMDVIRERLINQNIFAVLYTTHSHGANVTEISKNALRKTLKLEKDERIEKAHVIHYLRSAKSYDDSIIKSIGEIEERHVEGGIKLFVHHDPMDKFRIVMPLKVPFVVAEEAESQSDAIAKWKAKYAGAADLLEAFCDSSCVDPSRLFYAPAHAPGAEYRVEIVVGEFIDYEDLKDSSFKQAGKIDNPWEIASGREEGGSLDLENRWLMRFATKYAERFMIADFIKDYDDDIRKDEGEKVSVECPFDEDHTDAGNPEDMGFFATNPGEGSEGFFAHCMHATCKNNHDDRILYLDRLITRYGIESAEELMEYVVEFEGDEEVSEDDDDDDEPKAEKKKENPDLDFFLERIADVAENDIDALDVIADSIAEAVFLFNQKKKRKAGAIHINPVYIDLLTKEMAKKAGISATNNPFKKRINTLVRQKVSEKLDEDSDRIEVSVNADFETQIAMTLKALGEFAKKEKLYSTNTGIVRLVSQKKNAGNAKIEVLTKDRLFTEMVNVIRFYEDGPQGSRMSRPIPEPVLRYVYNLSDELSPLPKLRRIVKHPIIDDEGRFITEFGYDIGTQVFLDIHPRDILSLPKKITDADLDEAYDIIFEDALGDFPFKDLDDDDRIEEFTKLCASDDPEEKAKGEKMRDEFLQGESSKAHMLAMIVTPFVRDIIEGPLPAFLITKPVAGAGSGKLANVFNIIREAKYCANTTLPGGSGAAMQDEIRKAITAKLKTNPYSPMFFDNTKKIASSALASAITSGFWEDRILGGNDIFSAPIEFMWLFSGINVDISEEMSRRMVPIRLVPPEEHPYLKDSSEFKHPHLEAWCIEKRHELIWAVRVFIQNWIQRGMPNGTKLLGSFNEWSEVVGGILEAGGVYGFLANTATFRAMNSIETMEDEAAIHDIIDTMGVGKPFSAKELFDTTWEDESGGFDITIPYAGSSPAGAKRFLSRYLGGFDGKVFNIEGKRLTLLRIKAKNGKDVNKFYFKDITEGEGNG